MDSITVVLAHNYKIERKVFDFLFQAQAWAETNGFELVSTESPNVYTVRF